jgi:hypothetical protein
MTCLAEMSEELIAELIAFPVFFFTGLMLIGLAIPMILKKVPPNQWYGWRTPKAFRDEDTWYEINRYIGRDILYMGIIQVVFNCLMVAARFYDDELCYSLFLPGNLLILVGGTIIMMTRGFLYLKKL